MRLLPLLLGILPLFPSPAGAAVESHGRVFYNKLDPAKPSFTFTGRVEEKDGKTVGTSTYFDLQGKKLMEETAEFQDNRLLKYDYKQDQTGDTGYATFEGGKIQMTYTEDGKVDHDSETHDPATVVAPMIQPLIRKRWDEIMKGDSIYVRYLAIERTETIGFKFFKDGERVVRGIPAIEILMKPSSFIIAALVDPIHIAVMKDDPHWILETEGRTPIRMPKREPPRGRSDWKAIDARVEYDVPAPAKP